MSERKIKIVLLMISTLFTIFYLSALYFGINAFEDNKEYKEKHKNRLTYLYVTVVLFIILEIMKIITVTII